MIRVFPWLYDQYFVYINTIFFQHINDDNNDFILFNFFFSSFNRCQGDHFPGCRENRSNFFMGGWTGGGGGAGVRG